MQIDDLTKNKKKIIHHTDYLAKHYGFDFLNIEEKIFKKDMLIEDEKLKVLSSFKDEYIGKRVSPLKMFFYKKPILKKNIHKDSSMGLDLINVESAIAEATVIKTALSILENEGYKNFEIKLNAIGDKNSQKDFKQALTEYYRSVRSQLKAIEIKNITKDPLQIYYTNNKKYLVNINKYAPSPMEFLSDESISHFQEVIEFLESFNINYHIDYTLTGSRLFFSKIIFKIFANEPKSNEQIEVGYGGRYDEIAESSLKKKKISAIGLNLEFNRKNTKKIKLIEKKIKLHLLKIGSTSKLKYLEAIDAIAKTNTPISYDIKEEKISKQIKKAVEEDSDYAIIIGETEAKKGVVVVRKMKDFSQKEIAIKDLSKYIKKLIK